MRSKRYDQRYNQDEPGGGNGYIADNTNTEVRHQGSDVRSLKEKLQKSEGWHQLEPTQEVDVER